MPKEYLTVLLIIQYKSDFNKTYNLATKKKMEKDIDQFQKNRNEEK